jgi:septal ring factor EnvC (AmiA/AmiB activator)
VAKNLEAEAMRGMEARFRELNNTLVRNIQHFSQLHKAFETSKQSITEKRRLEETVLDMQTHINRLERELAIERSKRRNTLDTRLLMHQPETGRKALNCTFK